MRAFGTTPLFVFQQMERGGFTIIEEELSQSLRPEILGVLLTATFSQEPTYWSLSNSAEYFPLTSGSNDFYARSNLVLSMAPVCWWRVFFLTRVLQGVPSNPSLGSVEPPRVWKLSWWEILCIIFATVLIWCDKDFYEDMTKESAIQSSI